MWEGSVERSCGPMDKNRIRGAADQGERAINREALVTKGKRRRSGGRVCIGSVQRPLIAVPSRRR
jgi:hypothetical protein